MSRFNLLFHDAFPDCEVGCPTCEVASQAREVEAEAEAEAEAETVKDLQLQKVFPFRGDLMLDDVMATGLGEARATPMSQMISHGKHVDQTMGDDTDYAKQLGDHQIHFKSYNEESAIGRRYSLCKTAKGSPDTLQVLQRRICHRAAIQTMPNS